MASFRLMKQTISFSLLALTISTWLLKAEEGGTGHYLPGSMSSFVDGLPAQEAVIVRNNLLYYHGSVGSTVPLPIAGQSTLGASASSWGEGVTFLWRPPVELGEGWSYAMCTTVPYVWVDVSADVGTGMSSVRRSSSVNGLGDIVLMPLMLNYNVNSNLNVSFRTGIYAPTGSYEAGRLANTGKNFWTVEPTVGLMYFGVNNGREASLFVGTDFNTENEATHYRSGTQFHLDGTLAQHFPLAGGLAGAGVNGFWYQQISADSGSGATFGSFEGYTTGLGPAVSYVFKAGGHDMIGEVKWLDEVDTSNRLNGSIFWFKFVVMF